MQTLRHIIKKMNIADKTHKSADKGKTTVRLNSNGIALKHSFTEPETFNNKPESETIEFVKPKLKHSTSQKRVELIEKQKWELIAATATIDNQNKDAETAQKCFIELLEKHDNQNKELAELSIDLKSKDLQLQQVVQELQAVEDSKNVYKAGIENLNTKLTIKLGELEIKTRQNSALIIFSVIAALVIVIETLAIWAN